RRRKAGERRSTPKFLVINTMAAFDFAVLLRTPRLDVAQPHPRLLHREGKRQREFGAVVPLQVPDGTRECGAQCREEGVTGLLIVLRIETEKSVAGTVINGGVLEARGAGDFDFFDIHLHTVSRPLATKEGEWPRAPVRPPTEGWIPEPMTDAANRGSSDPDPMHAVQPDAGADRPVLKIAAGVLNQRDGRIRNAACPHRGIARDQAREAGGLPAATPRADRLPIQAKPPGGSFDAMFGGVGHDGETALDGVVRAFRDLQRRQFLGRDRRHAVPPSDGLRLSRSGGANSQQDISGADVPHGRGAAPGTPGLAGD